MMSNSSSQNEISHYVVTAHPPGSVLLAAKCNFLAPTSLDVLVAKSRRLEVRQLRGGAPDAAEGGGGGGSAAGGGDAFPVALTLPINGRLVALEPLNLPNFDTAAVFLLHDRHDYAVISYSAQSGDTYPVQTHASGSLVGDPDTMINRMTETGPIVAVCPKFSCIAAHVFDGLITVVPIKSQYAPEPPGKTGDGGGTARRSRRSLTGDPFHCRIEERTVLALQFLQTPDPNSLPQLCVLHQDTRGAQHVTSHIVNVSKQQLHLYGSQSVPTGVQWLKKSAVDGGSSLLIPVPVVQGPSTAPAAAAAAAPPAPPAAQTQPPAVLTPPTKFPTGGVVVVGQRQLTYCSPTATKVVPVPQALFLSWTELPPDPAGQPRYLLGDEFGNLHLLTCMTAADRVVALQVETLGSCTLSTCLTYLGEGLVYVGSALGDSQLVQIHDEPVPLEDVEDDLMESQTYLSVVEEYTSLGPILDFDLVPTQPGVGAAAAAASEQNTVQSQVVTCSGSSKSGSIRVIRNGIGMNEYAAVGISGIQAMWSVRKSWSDTADTYLVQSFVGETRVLGVLTDESMDVEDEEAAAGTLEEVVLPGLDASTSSLYVGNVQNGDRLLQITETEARLLSQSGEILSTWSGQVTVATATEAGQIAVAMQGGTMVYLAVQDDKIKEIGRKQMEQEVSCMDLHPFAPEVSAMDVDDNNDHKKRSDAAKSSMVAVGLWDDYTVRLLSLERDLEELVCINLSTEEEEETEETTVQSPSRRSRNNMMARSLSLITLDFSSQVGSGNSAPGVNMLFVGLGDGTLISFAVQDKRGVVSVQSRKEVCLGTQRIDLVPLTTEQGGTCVLATGDRPTVIYLAGVGGSQTNHANPKLCYSNVNVAASDDEEGDDVTRPSSQQTIAVNVAAPFCSPLLFDSAAQGSQHYSLCVADDSSLRLGVIDDIQKLHVTTCRLGMAPRRIVHCPDGRCFAVGCIESGINFGLGADESNMGNCIRIMDDTNFDDLDRIDLEPFEMILSMVYATMKMPPDKATEAVTVEEGAAGGDAHKPFLLVGTAYALADEDEPTRGRILMYTCQAEEGSNSRAIRKITEFTVEGGVYSMCQFYEGLILVTVNSKTMICQLVQDAGMLKLQFVGHGHYGHILSLFVKSRAQRVSAESTSGRTAASGEALSMDVSPEQGTSNSSDKDKKEEPEMLAIVGDLMRSISLVQYYPQHQQLEEVARDFNANWTCAVEMLTDHVYLGAENWNNLYCLRRNTAVASEEVRCRLDTVGEYHLGEMCNKFMSGSLVMPVTTSSSSAARRSVRRTTPSLSPKKKKSSSDSPGKPSAATVRRRPVVTIGSQTLFGTVDGSLGCCLGLDGRTTAFFSSLERSMAATIKPVGNFSHVQFRACRADKRVHPAHGFVDGDLVESFLDLDRATQEAVVTEMNRDGGWDFDDGVLSADSKNDDSETAEASQERPELTVDDVLAMVEEMSMLH